MTASRPLSHHLQAAAAALRQAGLEESAFEARALIAGVLSVSREDMLAHPERPVTAADAARLADGLARRASGEPLARITGVREFWSLPIRLGPDTLVPRPETETVVEEVLSRIADRDGDYSILDLGTGSGCLLFALLSELPRARGLGIDGSTDALAIAAQNAEILGFSDRVRFRAGNWGAGLKGAFDIIVANPPYIALRDKAALPREVRDFDPDFALFAGEDGLEAARALIPDLARLLAADGIAVVEIGAGQGAAVAEISRESGLSVGEARCDLAGLERALPLAKDRRGLARPGLKKKVGNRAVPV